MRRIASWSIVVRTSAAMRSSPMTASSPPGSTSTSMMPRSLSGNDDSFRHGGDLGLQGLGQLGPVGAVLALVDQHLAEVEAVLLQLLDQLRRRAGVLFVVRERARDRRRAHDEEVRVIRLQRLQPGLDAESQLVVPALGAGVEDGDPVDRVGRRELVLRLELAPEAEQLLGQVDLVLAHVLLRELQLA